MAICFSPFEGSYFHTRVLFQTYWTPIRHLFSEAGPDQSQIKAVDTMKALIEQGFSEPIEDDGDVHSAHFSDSLAILMCDHRWHKSREALAYLLDQVDASHFGNLVSIFEDLGPDKGSLARGTMLSRIHEKSRSSQNPEHLQATFNTLVNCLRNTFLESMRDVGIGSGDLSAENLQVYESIWTQLLLGGVDLHGWSRGETALDVLTRPFGLRILVGFDPIVEVHKLLQRWFDWLKEHGVETVRYLENEHELYSYGEANSLVNEFCLYGESRIRNGTWKVYLVRIERYLFLNSPDEAPAASKSPEWPDELGKTEFWVDFELPSQPRGGRKRNLTVFYRIVYDSRWERWWDPGADPDSEMPGGWTD